MAQVTGVSHTRPTLGFVPGPAASQLQRIVGIPGAARMGDPIALPSGVTQVFLAPGGAYVLAAQGAALLARRGDSSLPLRGALVTPDIISFSPSGRSVLLYSQSFGRVQVFTGLPSAPRLAQDLSNLAVPGAIRRIAVSDDAASVLVADASGMVYAVTPNTSTPLYQATEISALVFVSGSHDAILCDPAQGRIVLLQAGSSRDLLVPNQGCQAEAAASTADGRTILVACAAQQLIWSIDRQSGLSSPVKIPIAPTALHRLAGRDVFLLSPSDRGTYWIVASHPDGLDLSFVASYVPGAGQ